MKKRYANSLLSTIKGKSTLFANQTGEQVDTWVKEDGSGWTMSNDDPFYSKCNPYYEPAIHMIGQPDERTLLCDPDDPAHCQHTKQVRVRIRYD